MINAIHDNNMKVAIVSNGFWGKSIESAKSVIDLLTRAKWNPTKDILVCSTGDYHREWLPLSSIKTAITEYYSAFKYPIRLRVECITTPMASFKTLLSDVNPVSFFIIQSESTKHMYRFGREEPLVVDKNNMTFYQNIQNCKELTRLMVAPTGLVFPCCGFNDKNPGLSFINLNDTTDDANEMIKKANDSFIIKLLLNNEMQKVYSILLSNHPELPTHFAQTCELCEIICNEKYRAELIKEFPNL